MLSSLSLTLGTDYHTILISFLKCSLKNCLSSNLLYTFQFFCHCRSLIPYAIVQQINSMIILIIQYF